MQLRIIILIFLIIELTETQIEEGILQHLNFYLDV